MTLPTRYDVAEHLRNPEEMAAYLQACLEEADGDAAFIAKALGDIARAKGMTQVARDAGLSRESLRILIFLFRHTIILKFKRRRKRNMNTSVNILRSVVAPETVAQILENELGFSEVSCRFLHHGFNDTYEAQSQETPLIVRLYRHKWRSEKEIAAECSILQELSAAGLGVSAPISGPAGQYQFTLDAPEGLRQGVVFSRAEGNIPLHLGSGETRELGRILGTLHDRLDCLTEVGADRPVMGAEFFLDHPFQVLRRAFPSNAADLDRLELHFREGATRLPPFSGTRPDFGLVHGDFLRVNIFQNDAGVFTLFDFDFCGFSHRAYDLATYRWSLGPVDDPELKPLWTEFLSGYAEVHPLSPTELTYLDWFIQVRQLWVWSINVDTGDGFQRLNQHQFKARMAWFGL